MQRLLSVTSINLEGANHVLTELSVVYVFKLYKVDLRKYLNVIEEQNLS